MVTDVVYELGTNKVVMVKYDDVWVLPDCWGLAHFENDIEPVMIEHGDNCYLRPNTILFRNSDEGAEQ